MFRPDITYCYFPSKIATMSMWFGLLALLAAVVVFPSNQLPVWLCAVYVMEILFFFLWGRSLTHKWSQMSVKGFAKKIFLIGMLLRLPFTLYHHIAYTNMYGPAYYENLPDLDVYVGMAVEAVDNILQHGEWNFISSFQQQVAFDDIGAPIFNTILLLITQNFNPPLVILLVNVVLGALTCVFMYHLARRHFGEDVGRMTAIFCLLNPNMIWWCCSMMKETQMVFFTCWFLDRMDAVLTQRKVTMLEVIPIALLGMYVFLYRAALGILLFLSVGLVLLIASQRVVSSGKKVLASIMIFLVLIVGYGSQMIEQANRLRDVAASDQQKTNMEWRSTRRDGANAFAKYASAAVFAPLIFTIPFPTITYTYEAQESLMEVAGGNYVKNIFSFFVVLCMFSLLISGEWRQHVFPIAYLIGYLLILVMSVYAQSGRFHMPVVPIEMMFAAYGIKMIQQGRPVGRYVGNKSMYMRWFSYWCVVCLALIIFWQWFKLRGQGLI